jgi:hypothetical protein
MHIRPWQWAGALVAISPALLSAQASPYIPLDDPRLPLIELLITRGDIEDPSPMVRPFRRVDLLRVIDSAGLDSSTPNGQMALELRQAYRQEDAEAWGRVEGRAGAQAYSNARIDVLHPQGPQGLTPYVDVGLTGVFGPVVAVTRPAMEPRVVDDPTWPGRTNLEVAFRMREAYLSAQFKWFSIFFGDLQRQWGPIGQTGIPLSNYSYARTSWGLMLGKPSLNLRALGAELRDEVDSLGNTVHRYWFGHRFAFNLTKRFQATLWATVVLAGVDQNFTARYRNPVSILLLSNTYGLGDDGNIMVGTDLWWRANDWLTLEAQIGIDDVQYQDRSSASRFPDRLAGTIAAYGPLGRRLSWRVLYTRASSLAFRAQNPFQNFVDADVGIGRNFADNDLLRASISIPVRNRFVVAPEAVILRQGEGSLTDPIPSDPGSVPQIFIGTVETTYRLGLSFSGRSGMLELQTNVGVNNVHNAGHQAGRTVTEFRGWLQATLALDWQGVIK